MSWSDYETARIAVLEDAVNTLLTKVTNMISRAEYRQVILIKERELESLEHRVESLEEEIDTLKKMIKLLQRS